MRAFVLWLSLCTTANATTGLVWQWPQGEERRYYARTQLDLPEAFEVFGLNNHDSYVSRVQLEMVLRCAPSAPATKTTFVLRCDIDDVAIQARPMSSSRGVTAQVLPEWTAILKDQAWIEVEQGSNGRVRLVDLEGTEKRVQRMQSVSENLRLLVSRALAPLDLLMPKKGDDQGLGGWVQTESNIYGLPSTMGTYGSPKITHTIQRTDGDVVMWTYHGEGTIASGDEMGEAARITVAVTTDGSARFDTARGLLLESQYLADGQVTASSVKSEQGLVTYEQSTLIQYLPPEKAAPKLSASGELP